ncbi:MAG: hypothetical protein IKM43_03900 [Clostridia bacterium]|nr:hypothetical protein [Clostridia bacterium]
MAKRQYTLKEAREYIKEYYNLDWVNFEVRGDDGIRRSVKLSDFQEDRLYTFAYMTKGKNKEITILEITNNNLVLLSSFSSVSGFKTPRVSFKDFYTKIRTQDNKVEHGS